jgi:leader peptidase (prepilin peptidase)/N-methyltransferase
LPIVAIRWLPVVAAPFIGSFLGVLIRRLPAGRPIAAARSQCESCGRTLGPLDLAPIASFVLLRGRCRSCGAKIAPMHLAVELAATAVAGSAAAYSSGAPLWAGCALGWSLLALAWIDSEHFWLPDLLTLPLVVAGLVATALLAPDSIGDHAAAAALGYAGLRGLGAAYRKLRGREGIGQGDAKLLAACGAWLGVAALPSLLLVAAVLGLLLAGAWRLLGRRVQAATALPFGPALAAACWALWLFTQARP